MQANLYHSFRAKFFQRLSLFFRHHAPSKVIVFAWVNEDDTKRAHENSDDAYRVFARCWKATILQTAGTSCGPTRWPVA